MLSDQPDFIPLPDPDQEDDSQVREFLEGFNWVAFGEILSRFVAEESGTEDAA